MPIDFFPGQKNFLRNLFTADCAEPWYVYAETFLPAAIKLVIFTGFRDAEDLLRGHGEDISRDRSGGRKKRHSGRYVGAGRQTTVQRFSQKGLRTLLVLTAPLEFIGFHWLIYAQLDQFFYDWQSLIDLRGECKAPASGGPMQLSRGFGVISLVVGGVPVIMSNELQNRAGWSHSTLSGTLPAGQFNGVFGLSVQAIAGAVPGVWIQLRVGGILGDTIIRSDTVTAVSGQPVDLSVGGTWSFLSAGGGTITWEIGGNTVPAGIICTQGHLSVVRTG